MESMDDRINAIAGAPYPSYEWPLRQAKSWVRSSNDDEKQAASELLYRLHKRYPHALVFAQEQVLALIECGNRPGAESLLAEVEPSFGSPDEEILCRWGRIYKDQGDVHVRVGQNQLAVDCYSKARDRYHQGYLVRQGHYPGINEATLSLILASLLSQDESRRLEEECRKRMEELLASYERWPQSLPDDNVWHPATAGEAHLLQKDFRAAAARYHEALGQHNCQRFHRESMCKQVRRILETHQRMGLTDFGPFDLHNLESFFFGPPSPAELDTATPTDDTSAAEQLPQPPRKLCNSQGDPRHDPS